jgi:hypothetical protein
MPAGSRLWQGKGRHRPRAGTVERGAWSKGRFRAIRQDGQRMAMQKEHFGSRL